MIRGQYVIAMSSPQQNLCLHYTCATGYACYVSGPGMRQCFNDTTGQHSRVNTSRVIAGVSTAVWNDRTSIDGIGLLAQLGRPTSLLSIGDADVGIFLVTERSGRIRIVVEDGTVTTLAGETTMGVTGLQRDGDGTNAWLARPSSMIAGPNGLYYFATVNKIMELNLNGTVRTLAGSGTAGTIDGIGTNAGFNNAQDNFISVGVEIVGGLQWDHPRNRFLVADLVNACIRAITLEGSVTTVAGTVGSSTTLTAGIGLTAKLGRVYAIHHSGDGRFVLASWALAICGLLLFDPVTTVTTIIGKSSCSLSEGTGVSMVYSFLLLGTTLNAPEGALLGRDGDLVRVRNGTIANSTETRRLMGGATRTHLIPVVAKRNFVEGRNIDSATRFHQLTGLALWKERLYFVDSSGVFGRIDDELE